MKGQIDKRFLPSSVGWHAYQPMSEFSKHALSHSSSKFLKHSSVLLQCRVQKGHVSQNIFFLRAKIYDLVLYLKFSIICF